MTRAAVASAHHQPSARLASRPTSRTPDKYVQSRVCVESATADAEASWRPARRWASESTGMIASDDAAKAMPTVLCPARSPSISERSESIVTKAARAKKDTAVTRSARCSRASRRSSSRAANCQATAAAEDTSTIESRPNPMSAPEEDTVPADRATAASTML